VIGGDPAEGLDSGDDSVLQVLSLAHGEQVAELQGKVEPFAFAGLAYLLGTWFNDALVGIENNKDGGANRALFELRYPNIYLEQSDVRLSYDKPSAKLGWNTNVRSKHRLVAQGRKLMEDGSVIPHSDRLLSQFETFILQDAGYSAVKGGHDDLVMSWLIGIEMLMFATRLEKVRENPLMPLINGEPVEALSADDPASPLIPRSQRLADKVLKDHGLLEVGDVTLIDGAW
jgi:hypothetical protein